MNIETAGAFLSSSILMVIGFVVIVSGIVMINNILNKFWKPVQFIRFVDTDPKRFATEEEVSQINKTTEPPLEDPKK